MKWTLFRRHFKKTSFFYINVIIFLGSYLFNLLGISFAGLLGVVIESVIGACVLIFICRLLLGKR